MKYATLIKHGHKPANGNPSPTYLSWLGMKARCTNPNQDHYERYGGRGIKVCVRWRDNFVNFLEDMGERPKGMSLDRIDNSRDYTPDNCKWATLKDQGRNKRNNVWVTYNGKKMILTDWAKELGYKYANTLLRRHRKGWSPEEVLFGRGNHV